MTRTNIRHLELDGARLTLLANSNQIRVIQNGTLRTVTLPNFQAFADLAKKIEDYEVTLEMVLSY